MSGRRGSRGPTMSGSGERADAGRPRGTAGGTGDTSEAVEASYASTGVLSRKRVEACTELGVSWGARSEGVFEFVDCALEHWPDQCKGAYICTLSNPQSLDVAKLLGSDPRSSPFYKVLHAEPRPRMLMLANQFTPIHTRLWCVYEAFLAHDLGIVVRVAGEALHLLSGELADFLRLKEGAAARMVGEAREPVNNAVKELKARGDVAAAELGSLLPHVETALKEVGRAKLRVLRSADVTLVDFEHAACYSDADRAAIRKDIGDHSLAAASFVAGLVRDAVCSSVVQASESTQGVEAIELDEADLTSPTTALDLVARLWLGRATVTRLQLRRCVLSAESTLEVQHAVGWLSQLQELDLSGTELTVDGLPAGTRIVRDEAPHPQASLQRQRTLAHAAILKGMGIDDEQAQRAAKLAKPPELSLDEPSPLMLATGQLLLLRNGGLGEVNPTGVRQILGEGEGGEAILPFDACVQSVLPWRPLADDAWRGTLVADAGLLAGYAAQLRKQREGALTLVAEAAAMVVAPREPEAVMKGPSHNALLAFRQRAKRWGDEWMALRDEMLRSVSNPLAAAVRKIDATVQEALAPLANAGRETLSATPLERATAPLSAEELAARTFAETGALGVRAYAPDQALVVRQQDGTWRDPRASDVDALHPWNHTPCELSCAAFETMREWWLGSLRAQHSHVIDPLSGHRFDVMKQCVAIDVQGDVTLASKDAPGLSGWLAAQHAERVLGGACSSPCAALLTAAPAARKTTLLSQVVATSLEGELVPILVKVQRLQTALLAAPDAFAASWNFIDGYLRHEHGDDALYRCLRQAMIARRALILLDGLDEGGAKRDEIETHVAEVLAPQGHMLLCTSRPSGLDVQGRFGAFRHLSLAPLSPEQQVQALEQRLGAERAEALGPYLREKVPTDTESGLRVTANPLMLAMVASVFKRKGEMPDTVAALYATASEAMLERGGAATPHLTQLMQRIFFEDEHHHT